MTKEELLAKLRAAGLEISGEVRVQSHGRWRFILADGAIVDCLDDGSWTLFVHDLDAVRAALGPMGEAPVPIGLPIVIDETMAVAEPEAHRIRLELKGGGAGAPCTTLFFISEELARKLAQDLSAAAYQMRLCSHFEQLSTAVSRATHASTGRA